MENSAGDTRREMLRKAVFVSPLILTLPVHPSLAKAGSTEGHDTGHSVSHPPDQHR